MSENSAVWARLDELAALKPGWLDGQGIPPGPGVCAVAASIATSSTVWAKGMRIYPTPEGGIELEWADGARSHSITIGPDLVLDLMTADAHQPGHPDKHSYLSTGCLHGEHGYCQSNTGAAGAKIPAQCKFCAAPCRCRCHAPP
jgi:hypothetical protein